MKHFFADLVQPFVPNDAPPPQTLWPFLRWCLRGAWPVIALAAAFGLALGIAEAGAAWLVGYIVDLAASAPAEDFFSANMWLLLLAIAFFLILRPGLIGANSALNAISVAPNAVSQTLVRLNRHTMGQSLRYFENDFAGRIAQKQMQTGNAIGSVLSEVVNSLIYAVSVVIGSVLILGQVSLWLGVVMLVWLVLYVSLVSIFLPRIRKRSAARAGARAALSGQFVDTLSNISTVRLFARGGQEEHEAERAVAHLRGRMQDFGAISAAFRLGLALLAGLLPVALIGLTLWLWQIGRASPGDIAVAGLLSTRLGQMSGWISFVAMGIFSNIGEIENGMTTLSPPHEMRDPERPKRLPQIEGALRFDDVHFRYDGGAAGLHGLSLSIAPGERLGLVGPSGAGKSTALALLLRLYDVQSGAISLDGHDIRDLSQDDLRAAMAMVRQETDTFNRSARDNIGYGRLDADKAAIIDAARQAQADGFIRDLADGSGRTGYDAHLGERGVKLSGGQRQRVAIARAILKDAPILLLDEATSALDSETEAEVQSSLERLMQGRTVIAVAHRLSTIARMDRIVVMENGRIVEQGSHEDLLAHKGLYARSWARQSGGFMAFQSPD